jgi:selenocysteine lyase/cysteine desulfurase
MRAGWGTGFMAMSDRAVERIAPLLSGWVGFDEEAGQEIPAPRKAASAFSLSNPDRVAEARLAAAAESALAVGVAQIEAAISERIERVIDLADEFAIPVASSRDARERAGIVVLTPPTGQLTVLTASLFNHGVTVTSRDQSVRISAHASTDEETLGMLRGAFMSYATATGAY